MVSVITFRHRSDTILKKTSQLNNTKHVTSQDDQVTDDHDHLLDRPVNLHTSNDPVTKRSKLIKQQCAENLSTHCKHNDKRPARSSYISETSNKCKTEQSFHVNALKPHAQQNCAFHKNSANNRIH